ncbi:MAG: cell division protein FtsQ/DivIB [Propioniciclava sp.]
MEPLVDVTGVRRRRVRERRKRRWLITGVVASVVAVVAAGVWAVGWSPLFSTTTVVAEGLSSLTEAEVTDVAEVPLGEPLLRVDTGAIESRVADLPAVAMVAVRVALPDTVTINVTERTLALAVGREGAYTWVDPDGVVFHSSAEIPDGVVTAQADLADADLLAALARVADALPSQIRADVTRLSARTPDSITVELAEGRKIVWGGADQSAFKAEVLLPLLTVEAEVIDVSAPARPTTR